VAAPLIPDPSPPSGADQGSTSELTRPLLVVVGLVAVMWVVEVVDLLPGTSFDGWGIRPRTLGGLLRIPVAPFLHTGLGHLLANTLPFLVLGAAIALGGLVRFVQVCLIVGLVSGLGTWLFATGGTVHLGASGLVFGFLTYLITRGVFARNVMWLAGGLLALLVYGGILWGLLPRPGSSFSGHLFGALGGVLAAWLLHRRSDGTDDATL
jgi:membrane associated rhomboid family serine protease